MCGKKPTKKWITGLSAPRQPYQMWNPHQNQSGEGWLWVLEINFPSFHEQRTMENGASYLHVTTFPSHQMPMKSDVISHMSSLYLRIISSSPDENHWVVQWPISTHLSNSSNPSSKSRKNSISWSHAFTITPVQGVDGQVKPPPTTNTWIIEKFPNNKWNECVHF